MMKNILNFIFVVFVATFLSACDPSAKEINFEKIPDGLKDCSFYELANSNGRQIMVVRCPNSQTSATYKEGKATKSVVVVDGVKYEKAE